ncbi:MAG: hypothetical protein RR376_27115 [Janthinobacterium sp.]
MKVQVLSEVHVALHDIYTIFYNRSPACGRLARQTCILFLRGKKGIDLRHTNGVYGGAKNS